MSSLTAQIYSYTPLQSRVVELHDQYRTALMNAKYYASRVVWLKRSNTICDVVVAISASASFAGLAVWKMGIGNLTFSVLLGIAALVSALRPILRIADKLDRYSKLHYGYLEIYYRIEALVSEMRTSGHVTAEQIAQATELSERFRALELEGDAYQQTKKLLRYQDEIELSIPAERLWLPSE